jgi:hypothetical protein
MVAPDSVRRIRCPTSPSRRSRSRSWRQEPEFARVQPIELDQPCQPGAHRREIVEARERIPVAQVVAARCYMFFFFANKAGIIGSVVISIAVTLLLVKACAM